MNYKKILLRISYICLLTICIESPIFSMGANPGHSIGTITGKYHFSYNENPDQLVELQPPFVSAIGTLTYQWESSILPCSGFAPISGATQSSYTFSQPLTQTTYFRRKTTLTYQMSTSVYSSIIKIAVVSVNWEDYNYIREHDIRTEGITGWTEADQLAIGPKLQTTTYLDGLGRSLEKVSRETATPASGSLWGDVVEFSQYDAYGRQGQKFLPYTTTTESGKFKTSAASEQVQYYSTIYDETSDFFSVEFEHNPLNRISTLQKPGTSWAGSSIGVSASYEVSTLDDDVQMFSVDYTRGDPPVYDGGYPDHSLYKLTATDENGKKVVQYSDNFGRLILKKVQLDDSPSDAYNGWICTYNIYDQLGLLRYQIQPEGVKYLQANNWSFAGVDGQKILDEQCFQYDYDEKGRVIWKKAPGAAPLNMIYDNRDRIVFMQDGNQAVLSTPQWTVNLYDELDRQVATVLFNTSKTIAELQDDLAGASVLSIVTITNTANNGGSNITLHLSFNPVSSTDLNNSSVCIVLKYLFYDDYSYPGVKTFNTNYTNLSAYSASDPDVMPIVTSERTTGMPTGSKTRVLGSNTFLSSTMYYDERGQITQALTDNIKSGADIVTLQHHFDGSVLSSCSDHTTSGTGYTNFKTLNKYIFDKLGRVTSLQKQFGSNALKTVADYDYDDVGRIKTRHLDPDYTTGGNDDLESLTYSFNIHNQITGINKDYALKTSGIYSKWQHFFGLYLGFDNQDNVFADANLTGQVTGQLWNTQGDDVQRKYDYTYDNAGRLTEALFNEQKRPGTGWSKSQMDFSVNGANGKIIYDLNGNLLKMLHKGVIPGSASPITIDSLSYTYADYSNKLKTVTDEMVNTTVNGLSGDFKDGANGSDPDYVYDDNGNMVVDLNKNVQSLDGGSPGTKGISYNYLDKPELIRLTGKGTIRIVYSADGQKLQRAFIPEGGGPSTITSYINGFVYQETATITTSTPAPLGAVASLSFINFEEGRIRVVEPITQNNNGLDELIVDGNLSLPNDKEGVYDYFIMDYQQNVRMILTEETHLAANTCTMETADDRDELEESIFGQEGTGNEVKGTRYATPAGWQNTDVGDNVSRLGTNAGHNVGPNTLQKVMAGDKVSATVQYYYPSPATGNNGSTAFCNAVLNSLAQAITGSAATGLIKDNVTGIKSRLGGINAFIDAIRPGGVNPTGSTPQAYLTILFFDERFNFISAVDGGVAQEQVASSVTSDGALLSANTVNIKAPKNGYVFVYISNQTNEDVFFDNFKVSISAGNIIEENHYYAYGLKIAAISSKKLGDSYEGVLQNNYFYQGAYSELDDDIGWEDFELRNYDLQIGRWVQQDVYQQFASPYLGMGDDPITNIDPNGGEALPYLKMALDAGSMSQTAERAITLGEVVITASRTVSKASPLLKINSLVTILNAASTAINIINTSITTGPIGGGSSTRDNPTAIGMEAHKTLAAYVLFRNLAGEKWHTEIILKNRLRPDIVDAERKTVWELKPNSWQASESYKNYKKGKAQLKDYVSEINSGGHEKLMGTFTAGGGVLDAPIMSWTTLPSVDGGKRLFTYIIPNPASGMIFYLVQDAVPVKKPVFDPNFKPDMVYGYPGAGVGKLVSRLIEKITGKDIFIPDPVIGPVPSPVTVPAF